MGYIQDQLMRGPHVQREAAELMLKLLRFQICQLMLASNEHVGMSNECSTEIYYVVKFYFLGFVSDSGQAGG